MNITAQKDYYALKHKQIIIARNIKDIERQIHRKEEDKKYSTVLANRSRKDEVRRTKHKAKNNELRDIKKMIKDKERVSD
jgi:hypothetical protein